MEAQIIQKVVGMPSFRGPLSIAGTLGALMCDQLSPADRAQELVVARSLPVNVAVSPPINPSFPGFAFEQASFYNYSFTEDGSPNLFSQNLIDSVMSRTGGVPLLRVGGTSGDHGKYDPLQTDVCSHPATKGGPRFGKPWLSIGPSYFKAFENFPGARYIFMVPLAHQNLTNTLEWTSQGLEVIGDRLEALEIGNEPDLYRWYTLEAYVAAFNEFAKALSAKFPEQLGEGKQIYQALDTASSKSFPKEKLGTKLAFRAGINETGQVKQIGYHLYQKVDQAGENSAAKLQFRVANHTAIVQEMAQYIPYIKYLQENSPGAPFILSEVGNSLGRQHIHMRNVFATALWNLDYQLYALSIGVTLVNNQQIVLPGFQMWEPVQSDFSPPLVRANFYSQPFVADFISTATASRGAETRVVEVKTYDELISAYAAYDNGKLSRLAVVNMHLWDPEDGDRSNAAFTISGLQKIASSVNLTELTSPNGLFDQNSLTYGGLRWSFESQGKAVQVGPEPETVKIVDGQLLLTVDATSAVLVHFNDV